MKNGQHLILDFKSMPDITLFTGPKNGKKFRKEMKVCNFDHLSIQVKEGQVITSSFFYGLIGEELKKLFKKLGFEHNTEGIKKLKEILDYSELSEINKSEFERFLRRCVLNF